MFQRFNVAVTRAKSLLIIVGNPYLLESDHNWGYMLRHIWVKGGYTGCKYIHDVDKPLPPVEDHSERESSKVHNNFQKLLSKNKKVVADLNAAEMETAFATDSSIDELIEQIKQISFFTGSLFFNVLAIVITNLRLILLQRKQVRWRSTCLPL
jgi:hypothetical protein